MVTAVKIMVAEAEVNLFVKFNFYDEKYVAEPRLYNFFWNRKCST